MAKGAGIDERIYIEENCVGRVDDTSCSRFRLWYPAPFSMILSSGGIGRRRSRLKGRKLLRVGKYVIEDEGAGVIFDYGDMRVWNAEVEPERDCDAEFRDFMRRKPKDEMEKEIQENLRIACVVPAPKPWLENLIPGINKYFDFRIGSLWELPEDVKPTLQLIKRIIDQDCIEVKIDKKKIRFNWVFQGHNNKAEIPVVYPHPWPTISFGVNPFDFERLIKRGTYLGFEKPDSPGKDHGFLYFKDRQGEHLIPIFNIQRGGQS